MLKSLVLALTAIVLSSASAMAQDVGSSEAPLPRSMAAPFRLIPVAGASSFTTASSLSNVKFDQGFSAGLLGDFGENFWTFETGILALNSAENRAGDTAAVTVNSWGVPLLAKVNFSGHPHQTVFAKIGAMPFTASGASSTNFDVMAVGGIGGAIPLGRNSSLVLDASYNRLFTRSGNLTDYQGIALLAGLSLNI
jgi:hypothetical protein